MALGAVTLVKKTVIGDMQAHFVDIVLTSGANYTDNGEAFDVAQIPGATGTLLFVDAGFAVPTANPATNGIGVSWDSVNKKLVYWQSTTGAPSAFIEVAANTDLSGVKVRAMCLCK